MTINMTTNRILGYFFFSLVLLANTTRAQDEFGTEEPMAEPAGEPAAEPAGELEAEPTDEPEGNRPISLGLLLGYGIDFEEGDFNPFGFGIGLRGGYTLDMGLYLGAQFIYFIGDEAGGTSINVIPIGIEGGWDFGVGPLVIRPSLGFGLALVSATVDNPFGGGEMSESEGYIYFAPGASLLYSVDMFFVGADLRFIVVLADEEALEGLTIMANAGIKL